MTAAAPIHRPLPHETSLRSSVTTPFYDKPRANATQDIDREVPAKLPALHFRRRLENASLRNPQNPTDIAFTRWNPDGDHRAKAPLRGVEGTVDPVSNFYSAGGDADMQTGRTAIPAMVHEQATPHARPASRTNSIRVGCESAPPETRRSSEKDPGTPYPWNSRKVIDVAIRAALGGWTSDQDPRQKDGEVANQGSMSVLKDKLVLQHTYKSSIQRSYEEVPWDRMLRPRRWPATSTLELRPDMVTQTRVSKRFGPDPVAEDAQALGRRWDPLQTRQGFFKAKAPMPGNTFCSHWARADHTPLYSGCIGARNLDDLDNASVPVIPFTTKRVITPRPTETAHRPHIPKYTGCTQYKVDQLGSIQQDYGFSTTPQQRLATRSASASTGVPEFVRESQMSKMVTTVPPYNPFNKLRKIETVTVN